jgi:glycerophosphoryl diester phosphodiesterase
LNDKTARPQDVAEETAAVPTEAVGPRGPVRLKWHKLRTRYAEAPFKPANLALGWRAGATLEIDILVCRDDRFAVLHDATLGPSTTGRGRVADTPLAAMAGLSHYDRAGDPDPEAPVLSLAELLAPLATLPRAPAASLQLDIKLLARSLPHSAVTDAAAAVAGFEEAVIIGSMDLEAARRLAEAMPGAQLGYDPLRAVERSPDLARAPERLLRHMERRKEGVSLAYLHYDLVLNAAADGFPLVDRLLDLGIETDAWTLNPGADLTDHLLQTLLNAGVRQITTDAPAELARRIAALGG